MDLVVFDINSMAPHEIVGAMAQLLLALAVFGNMMLSWRTSRRVKVQLEKTDEVAHKVEVLHASTNGLKDELVKATRVAGESKGREDERREARGRAVEERNYKDRNEK